MKIVNCRYSDLTPQVIEAPDTLLDIPVSSWLEKLSDSERDIYEERAAIIQYDGGLPREQAEVAAIKRIIQERIIPGKCDKCERVSCCMLIPGQRVLCEVVRAVIPGL